MNIKQTSNNTNLNMYLNHTSKEYISLLMCLKYVWQTQFRKHYAKARQSSRLIRSRYLPYVYLLFVISKNKVLKIS